MAYRTKCISEIAPVMTVSVGFECEWSVWWGVAWCPSPPVSGCAVAAAAAAVVAVVVVVATEVCGDAWPWDRATRPQRPALRRLARPQLSAAPPANMDALVS